MADHRATADEMRAEVERAQARELEARAAFMRAVEYRVRMQISLELTEAREAGEL